MCEFFRFYFQVLTVTAFLCYCKYTSVILEFCSFLTWVVPTLCKHLWMTHTCRSSTLSIWSFAKGKELKKSSLIFSLYCCFYSQDVIDFCFMSNKEKVMCRKNERKLILVSSKFSQKAREANLLKRSLLTNWLDIMRT